MKRLLFTVSTLASLIVSLVVAIAITAPAAAGAVVPSTKEQPSNLAKTQTSDRVWYWSRPFAENALRHNGVEWSNAYDKVRSVQCAGLGKWIVSGGVPMFRDFHCLIHPYDGAAYKIVFHAATQREYRFKFSRYQTKADWVWTPQYAADALLTGVRWDNGRFDRILASTCAAFGPSTRIDGVPHWALYYCTVRPARGLSYGVVLDVVDRVNFRVTYVAHTDELAQTPAVRTPAPSSNTTNETLQKNINNMLANGILVNQITATQQHMNQMNYGRDFVDPISIMLGGTVRR